MPASICDLGSSVRNGNMFTLTVGDQTYDVDMETCLAVNGVAPKCAKIHKAIYENQDVTIIKHLTEPDVVAVSCTGEDMRPMIDDFAQIVGVDVKNCSWIDGDTDDCAAKSARPQQAEMPFLLPATARLLSVTATAICRLLKSLWIRVVKPLLMLISSTARTMFPKQNASL